MPDSDKTRKAIKKTYDTGMSEVQRILFSIKSTPAQRKVARKSLDDLTAMLLGHTLKTVEGRTAILAGLIVELNEVIAKIQTKPPYANAVSGLTGVLNNARKLFETEMSDLV